MKCCITWVPRLGSTVADEQSCSRLREGQWGLLTNGQKTLAMKRLPETGTVLFARMEEDATSLESTTFLQSILAIGVTASQKMETDTFMCPGLEVNPLRSDAPSDEDVAEKLLYKQVSKLEADGAGLTLVQRQIAAGAALEICFARYSHSIHRFSNGGIWLSFGFRFARRQPRYDHFPWQNLEWKELGCVRCFLANVEA